MLGEGSYFVLLMLFSITFIALPSRFYQVWDGILDGMDTDLQAVFKRYDLVLHLVTAAEGAEKFYTTKNNTARKETPAEVKPKQEMRTYLVCSCAQECSRLLF